MKKDISQLRKEIDCVDIKILKLIEERAHLVKEVGEVKGKTNSPIYVPEREENIFQNLSKNSNVLTYENIRGIFTEIISSCRNLEKHLTVYTFGEFSPLVAYRVFGNAVSIKKMDSLECVSEFFKHVNNNENLFLIENDFCKELPLDAVALSEIDFSNKKFIIFKKLGESENRLGTSVSAILKVAFLDHLV